MLDKVVSVVSRNSKRTARARRPRPGGWTSATLAPVPQAVSYPGEGNRRYAWIQLVAIGLPDFFES